MAITTETEAYSNPVRLSVATRESNAAAGPSSAPLDERDRLLRARKSNELVRRKGEKWADKLMEETVDPDTFKRALRYITSQQYIEITTERHLNNLCSYPLCSKPPLAPYNPLKKFKISTMNRSITEVQGNKEEGYCTRACRVKSEWVRMKLDEAGGVLGRGKGWKVELVEDLGLDLDSISGMVDSPKPNTSGGTRTSTGTATIPSTTQAARPTTSDPAERIRPPAPAPITRQSIPRIPNLAPSVEPTDLLANLLIHERPTTSPSQPPIVSHKPLHDTTPGSTPPKKRAPTSIVGEQSKLAQTVLQASKRINPLPQVNPDSEEEGEHEEVEWEREVGLGWEAEEDGGELWEAMRVAQEMVR